MARLRFDDRDKAALHKLDTEVVINDSNEVAVIAGEIEVEIMRLAGDGGDQFRLRFKFPGEPPDVKARRVQFLRGLGIKDES